MEKEKITSDKAAAQGNGVDSLSIVLLWKNWNLFSILPGRDRPITSNALIAAIDIETIT